LVTFKPKYKKTLITKRICIFFR